MCKVKIISSIAIFSILCFGGFFVFINFQEKKLIFAIDHLIHKAQERKVDLSYDSIKKNIFSFKPEIEISQLKIKMRFLDDVQNKELKSETEITFEKILVDSDLWARNFQIKNISDHHYKTQDRSEIIKNNFKIDLKFFENPFQKNSQISNLKNLSYRDNGYQVFDVNKNLLDEYSGHSSLILNNISTQENNVYNVKINTNRKSEKIHEITDEKEIAMNELSHSKITLDLDILKPKTVSQNVNLDIKNLAFETKESIIDAIGKIQLSAIEKNVNGDAIINFQNYQKFFKLLKSATGDDENYLLNFIEKTLPEISEQKSENILSLKYEQKGGDIKIGNKDFTQLSKDYMSYIVSSMKDKVQNLIPSDNSSENKNEIKDEIENETNNQNKNVNKSESESESLESNLSENNTPLS